MARRNTKINVLRFLDTLSQDDDGKPSTIGLLYRMPTTEERQQYLDGRQVRNDTTGKLEDRTVETRIASGKTILMGIEDGSFEDEDASGNVTPVSSDKQSPHFREDWKDFVEEFGSDLLILLAIRIFEGSALPAKRTAKNNQKPSDSKEDVDQD